MLPFWGWGQGIEPEEGDKGGYTYHDKVIKQKTIPPPLLLNPQHPIPNTNYDTYIARDTIRLLPGFNSSVIKGGAFTGKIDETLVFPVDYQDPINPDTRELDLSKPVGTIAGTVDVSPTGAATYQIPIFTPPGTAGMQPQISIVYNSQGGNGLLGVGWDIAGLSAITRTPPTLYHEGESKEVNFTASDRFALDGNRLILLEGAYNKPNYKTSPKGRNYDPIGHSQIDIDGNIIIDWGPNPPGDGLLYWTKGRNDWERGVLLSNQKGSKYWDPIDINGANLNTLEAYGRMLDKGGTFNLAINSCVSQASRALNLSGVFNIGILPGINHPYWLHFQMYMRSIGFRPSIYSYWLID